MNKDIQTEQEYNKNEMVKKASKYGLKFNIDNGTKDGDLEIISCIKRNVEINKEGFLLFKVEENLNLRWVFLLIFLGTLVPTLMFMENNLKIKIFAIGIFTIFQVGAIALVNFGRVEVKIFDINKKVYYIKRPNHILTRLFRKTYMKIIDLNKIKNLELKSFEAKRWEMRWIGSGESKYSRQELRKYENYRLSLNTIDEKEIIIYDYYDLDSTIEIAEKIAKYLNIKLII